MQSDSRSIKKSMVAGAAWMIFLKGANRGIGLVSTMILARLLTPNDYGVVAMAMSFYVLIEIMVAFGFDTVLVKKEKCKI